MCGWGGALMPGIRAEAAQFSGPLMPHSAHDMAGDDKHYPLCLVQVQSAVVASGRLTAPHVIAKVHRSATRQVCVSSFLGELHLDSIPVSLH